MKTSHTHEAVRALAETTAGKVTIAGAGVSTTAWLDSVAPWVPVAGFLVAVLGLCVNAYFRYKTYQLEKLRFRENKNEQD